MEGRGSNIYQKFSTKKTVIECHIQVWNVWMLILFIMPLICGGGGHFLFIQIFFWTMYTYELLQAFPQKHL